MILRGYQQDAVAAIHAAIDNRPCLVAPTGAGKTVIASTVVRDLGVPSVWCVHRRELVMQAATALRRLGCDVGMVLAGEEPRPAAAIQVASIQSLIRRETPKADLVVFDEAHHSRATTFNAMLAAWPGVRLLGATATPFRADGKGLGSVFGELIVAAHTDDLCNNGTLVEPVVYAPTTPDLSGVRMRGADYDPERAAKRVLVGDVVETWLNRAKGRRTVVYASTVDHSRKIVEAFRAAGVKAEHLDGTTPKAQRDATLHRLRTGYTTIVSNVQVLEEGWDLPALECGVIARPTASLCLHLQMIGRIMRAAEGKGGAIVLDHAGNHLRHGVVTQRISYSLADSVREGNGRERGAGPKACPACSLIVSPGASECPECGWIFTSSAREITTAVGELVHFAGRLEQRPSLAAQQHAWDVLEQQRQAQGYRESWTFLRFQERFGFRPLVHRGVVCDPETTSIDTRVAIYGRFLAVATEKSLTVDWANEQYRAIFGAAPHP